MSQTIPTAFPAYEDVAAYCDGSLTRSQAITEGREAHWDLQDQYARRELRAVRVWMQTVEGDEADEFFGGEFDRGWIEVNRRPLNAAQRANLIAMWKVEPRPPSAFRRERNDGR